MVLDGIEVEVREDVEIAELVSVEEVTVEVSTALVTDGLEVD